MTLQITTPALPESVADAQLLAWRKSPGDPITRDEILVEVETDKVVLEVVAPQDGTLTEILHPEGATVKGGDPLATMTPGKAAPPAKTPTKETPTKPDPTPDPKPQPKPETPTPTPPSKTSSTPNPPPTPPTPQPPKPTPSPTAPTSPRQTTREPMTRVRQTIATRLIEAQQTAALLTTFNQANMQTLMDLRARHRDQFEKTHGIRLGLMSFFVKASVAALQKFPIVGASIDGTDLLYPNYCDIGIAVASQRGLVVPVLRNAETLTIAAIETQIRDFSTRANAGTLELEELNGGTFTITNGGVFGSLLSTPIINPPQSAILGMHAIEPRPIAENDQVVIRPMMYLALTYDHRLIDGQQAVQFLLTIKNHLEDPTRMLLDL